MFRRVFCAVGLLAALAALQGCGSSVSAANVTCQEVRSSKDKAEVVANDLLKSLQGTVFTGEKLEGARNQVVNACNELQSGEKPYALALRHIKALRAYEKKFARESQHGEAAENREETEAKKKQEATESRAIKAAEAEG